MSQTLKAFKPTPLPLTSITPLDFDKPVPKLPPSHTWPLSSIQNHPLETIDVPVIDMKKPDPDQIRYACKEWGVFTSTNHGISNRLMEDFKREIVTLFSLPMDVKLRVLRSPQEASGYGGVPVTRFSPNKMWHEGFGIQNQVMEEYQKAMKKLAEKVLTLMLASVGLTPDDTNWAEPKTKESPFGPHGTHFQLNSYPSCPDPDHAMGLTQHTDSSIITLLNQVNNTSGLQVLHKDKWVNVKPIPGSFVINCGDLAHFFFNGRFVSPVHRVIPSSTTHRYSAAYFYGPPFGAPVAPIPKLVGPGRMPMYHTITWEDYQNAKNQIGNKVFDLVRVEKAKDQL
ncbi:hypothetical protein V2J09_002425 [Rumex salicifolius]